MSKKTSRCQVENMYCLSCNAQGIFLAQNVTDKKKIKNYLCSKSNLAKKKKGRGKIIGSLIFITLMTLRKLSFVELN